MSDLITLREPRLVPVLELESWAFSVEGRPRPHESGIETPEEWGRYWLDRLADSGIAGLVPLRPSSWHVPAHELSDHDTLAKLVRILNPEVADISTPERVEEAGALTGGLALVSRGEVLVEPTCCSDLGNLSEWRAVAGYRGPEWRMLCIRPVKAVLDARATPAQAGSILAPALSRRPRSFAPRSGRSPAAGRSPSGSPARP